MNSQSTDTELISLLNGGNIQAFDALYFRYHKAVFANIFKFVRRQEDTEELLQDVFVALWENKQKLNPQLSILGWLTIVSHNKAINHLNKTIKESLIRSNIIPTDIAELPEINDPHFDMQLQFLEEAINQLPIRKMEAFLLCKLQGKTYEETASLLGISVNTVKEHVVTASKFIRVYTSLHHASTTICSIAIAFILQ